MTPSSLTAGRLMHVMLDDDGHESPTPQNATAGQSPDQPRRDFYLYLPQSTALNRLKAIVLMLHGRGGNGRGAALRYGWCELAEKQGFACLFPQGLRLRHDKPERFLDNPRVWNDGFKRDPQALHNDDTGYLTRVIHWAHTRLDHNHKSLPVFATGFSNGASMAFRFALEKPSAVQGIAPICGYCPSGINQPGSWATPDCLFVMGASDPINPPAGGAGRNLWGPSILRPSAADSISEWLQTANPKAISNRPGPLQSVIASYESDKRRLDYMLVPGLGHTWPGSREVLPTEAIGPGVEGFDFTEEIWSFFSQVTKQRMG